LSFDPATALHQGPHTYSMQPLMRLVAESKSGAILGQILFSATLISWNSATGRISALFQRAVISLTGVTKREVPNESSIRRKFGGYGNSVEVG
jgi:hypothetical protein